MYQHVHQQKYKIWFEKGGDSSKGDVQKNIHPT